MLKQEQEYQELYGDIPKDYLGRLDYILSQVKSGKSVKGKLISKIDTIRNIKWETLSYTIYLVPKATPRPRTSFRNHFYVSGASDNKKLFKKFYKQNEAYYKMIVTPCTFTCVSYLPIPKSMKMYEQVLAELGFIRPISKPDFDNLAKTYTDMIQGTLLYDDSLIIEGASKKYYSVKPRIEITISYMTDFDSEYNRKKVMPKVQELAKSKGLFIE